MVDKNKYFFEVSWEICNKTGGIYTVIKSKAAQMLKKYSNYYLIGPYFPKKAMAEFDQEPIPENFKKVFEELEQEGIKCFYGRWMVKGKPKAILIDFSSLMQHKDGIKSHLWEKYQVDSLRAGYDFDEPLVWGWAVGKLIEKLMVEWDCPKTVVQGHEWLSGSALLYIEDKDVPAATVFTTHATTLGRAIAGSERPLYEILKEIDADKEAKNCGVESKHSLEKVSAQRAGVFTTVSNITGLEAKHILGREPDILLPNGLDFDKFPDLEEIPTKHKKYKSRVKEFLMPFFFPYYTFDLDKSLFFYISGRCEFRNKGIDVYIDALGKLNEKLKKEKSERTIVAFIFVPADVKSMRLDVVENKSLFEDIEDSVDDYMKTLRQKIIYSIAKKKLPDGDGIFDEDFLFEMKKTIVSFKKEGNPPLSTHELANPDDAIVHALYRNGLDNKEDDKVKVVYYPIYLSSSDGLLDLDYYNAVWACHFGVFPSYYEPWGYTPLESAAYGVPAVTTDLAGFGIYVKEHLKEETHKGIYVLRRKNKGHGEIVEDLSKVMFDYAVLPKKKRIQNKITAEHFAPKLDWKFLIDNYIKAHELALKRKYANK